MKPLRILLGAVVLSWGCAAMFAPGITDTRIHRMVTTKEQCLSCHLEGKEGAPKAPARMLKEDRKNCIRCHR